MIKKNTWVNDLQAALFNHITLRASAYSAVSALKKIG